MLCFCVGDKWVYEQGNQTSWPINMVFTLHAILIVNLSFFFFFFFFFFFLFIYKVGREKKKLGENRFRNFA